MKKTQTINHEFVQYIPNELQDGVVYISISYGTVVHKCFCGCGSEVVTPLSPNDWSLTYDGMSISLSPSIGNWSYPCQSHYWIEDGKVKWAGQWSRDRIETGRRKDRQRQKSYYHQMSFLSDNVEKNEDVLTKREAKMSLWQKLLMILKRVLS